MEEFSLEQQGIITSLEHTYQDFKEQHVMHPKLLEELKCNSQNGNNRRRI